MSCVLGFVATSALSACERGEPPGAEVDASVSTSLSPLPAAIASSSANACDAAGGNCAAPGAADPGNLPQTSAMPGADGTSLDARVHALWDAIVGDDPKTAMTFFFPLGAYKQVKDVADPESDWKHRLASAYERDIHALHARLGSEASRAHLLRLDIPDSPARWVEPGEEWNKIGYFRVFGSRLRYAIDGNEHTFDVKSLISWRGDWYVVHLSAFK